MISKWVCVLLMTWGGKRKVLEEATKIAYSRDNDNRRIRLHSDQHRDRKAKLLGHIARATNNDPLREIIL